MTYVLTEPENDSLRPLMPYITSPKCWYLGMRLNSYSCKSKKIPLLLVESHSNSGVVRDTNLIWYLMTGESQQSTVNFLKNVLQQLLTRFKLCLEGFIFTAHFEQRD